MIEILLFWFHRRLFNGSGKWMRPLCFRHGSNVTRYIIITPASGYLQLGYSLLPCGYKIGIAHIRFLTEVSGDVIDFEPMSETDSRSFQEIFKEMAGRRFTSDDLKKEK